MAISRLQYLFDRHVDRAITAEEREEFFSLLDDPLNDNDLRHLIDQAIERQDPDLRMPEESARAILETILRTPLPEASEVEKARQVATPVFSLPNVFRHWGGLAAAAVLVMSVAVVIVTRMSRHHVAPGVVNAPSAIHDIAPGGDKATLTLADGSTIVLDSAKNGLLTRQGNTTVIKTNKGQLAYAAATGKDVAMVYNMISTPIRGQYQVALPDGSKVWLNALSSLRFPTSFTGKARQVEVTGEAYFEIAKDPHSPFVVSVLSPSDRKLRERIEVLGTAFNVMGYKDEPAVKTTLVSGAVRVRGNGGSVKIAAGQQAQLDSLGNLRLLSDANVEKAVAWRNGNFQFDGDDIDEVMRQLTRWYGVEVKYDYKPQVHYTGGISRNLNISSVLHMLSLSGLHCRIEGNTLFVTP
jgi:transmembrane sensor